ncbi:drug/metabolite transporter (DMT)-like permease [Stella humosa]|uniref:Drug/metabolite transporter (DMT)-like permease n=2 Tax=Stella humosa TaxID=94 RepID=A0A3N1MJ20_9PROT|nr:drug/metabolite transporter (DMT)-like permease [Stella humosa]BBK31448.1 membrane protein [Stella humosa]
MLVATVAFMLMQAGIRHMTGELHPFVVAFFRTSFGLVVLAPWVLRMGSRAWKSTKPSVHLFRGTINTVSMLCNFVALSITPLAQVTALSFTAPLFATLGAILFLGERVRLRRWLAIGAGFLGALVILRPGLVEVGTGPLLALTSSALWAMAMLIIKVQSRTDSSITITLYMALVMSPLALLAALPFWTWPSAWQFLILFGISTLGTIGQVALAQSFREADTTVVLPFDFLKLIWATALGFTLFGEVPDLWTWVGGTVIFTSTVYIAWREAKARRHAKTAGDGRPATR